MKVKMGRAYGMHVEDKHIEGFGIKQEFCSVQLVMQSRFNTQHQIGTMALHSMSFQTALTFIRNFMENTYS
jgi:hypothetical protein